MFSCNGCNTALYIIARAHTIAPVFVITFSTIHHYCCAFLVFLHRAAQSLFLNLTVLPKYGKATVVSSGYRLTRIVTLLASKQCCISPVSAVISLQYGTIMWFSDNFLGAKGEICVHITHNGVRVRGVPPGSPYYPFMDSG